MIFNSLPFVVFFTVFFLLYWYVFKQNLRLQNLLVLAGSYIFYGWWSWRFLLLLIAGSLINYYTGIYLSKTQDEKKRKWLVYLALLQGLGTLVFFKYYDFFITSFVDAFSWFNVHLHIRTLNLLLPLGISFYTFRTISYILDIDNEKIEPCTDWVVFFSYVAFFPSLISGPIDKGRLLIPQLEKKRVFDSDRLKDGMRQVLWGLFKKMVVADNCSVITNHIFDNYSTLPGSTLAIGAFLYMFQIYADFSGYSDMAIGISKMLGFNITRNFNYPIFAQNIADYWRRWHISLTSWFTEYVFTPLNYVFRKYKKTGLALAIIINFTICGIWHGASWTFVLFGFIHGCYFIPLIIKGTLSQNKPESFSLFPAPVQFANIIGTMLLVMIAEIIFRSDSVTHAIGYYRHLFSSSLFSVPVLENSLGTFTCFIFICILVAAEWLQRDKEHALQFAPVHSGFKFYSRVFLFSVIAWSIIIWSVPENKSFIYFQF